MATVSGQGTTFNLPNYTGELFSVSPADTPFLSAIGGLSGGKRTSATAFEWQTEDMEATSANNSVVEGADAPAASGVSRSNVSNVVEIHQEAIEVSYTKQAATGLRNGLNIDGSNPVGDELSHQVNLKLRKVAVDVEKSFLTGTYASPSTNGSARKTRGLLTAISTNATTPEALDKAAIDTLLQDMYGNGAPLDESTVFVVPPALKVQLSTIYTTGQIGGAPESRNVGGVNIQTVVTDFGTFGVMMDRWMPADTLAVANLGVCAPVFLTIPDKGHLFVEPLAKTGSADKYQVYGEVGLEYGPEQYHGKLTVTPAAG